jgi:hypothetical protein
MYGSQVEPALPQRNHGANSRDTTETPTHDATDPDHNDTATRSRVTPVDASTRVNTHDQNADTLALEMRGRSDGAECESC